MNTTALLAPDEIEVLLNRATAGDYARDIAAPELPPDNVKSYDFRARERTVRREHVQTLEKINARLADSLRQSLFRLWRRAPTLNVSGIQLQHFSDFSEREQSPMYLNAVHIAPLHGRALIAMDARLVHAAVDLYFGGNGRFEHYSLARGFTQTETRIARKILDAVVAGLQSAWEPVLAVAIEAVDCVDDPRDAAIAEADDYVVATAIDIRIAGSAGELNLLLPYSMLEPIGDLLLAHAGHDARAADPDWRAALESQLLDAKINVDGVLAETSLLVGEVLGLKKGDVIPIELPSVTTLRAEGVPLFVGKTCTTDNHPALEIIDKIGNGPEFRAA